MYNVFILFILSTILMNLTPYIYIWQIRLIRLILATCNLQHITKIESKIYLPTMSLWEGPCFRFIAKNKICVSKKHRNKIHHYFVTNISQSWFHNKNIKKETHGKAFSWGSLKNSQMNGAERFIMKHWNTAQQYLIRSNSLSSDKF